VFWNISEHFESLMGTILSFLRKRLLLDFYDVDMVEPGAIIHFNTKSGSGRFLSLKV